jgi:hypothetical protein
MGKKITVVTDTIASGTTTAAINLQGKTLYAIGCPGSLSSTSLTFTASPTKGGTFLAVEDEDGAAISITVEASKFVAFNTSHIALRAIPWIKLVFGSSETDKIISLYLVEE